MNRITDKYKYSLMILIKNSSDDFLQLISILNMDWYYSLLKPPLILFLENVRRLIINAFVVSYSLN